MSEAHEKERRIERLLGRRVRDRDGRVVGRIEEFQAEREGDYFVVAAIDVGPAALLERLAVRHLGVTWPGRAHGYRARWDQVDLDDEDRPALTCGIDDLERLGPNRPQRTR